MAAPSDPRVHLRVGSAAEMRDAVSRSHLADGRVVGWYGAPGTVVDAEIRGVEPPHLVARFGAEDFLERWTRAECAAKLADVPMQVWIVRHGLTAPGIEVETFEVEDLVVSVGRCEKRPRLSAPVLLRAAPRAPRGVVVSRRCWRIASLLRLAMHSVRRRPRRTRTERRDLSHPPVSYP